MYKTINATICSGFTVPLWATFQSHAPLGHNSGHRMWTVWNLCKKVDRTVYIPLKLIFEEYEHTNLAHWRHAYSIDKNNKKLTWHQHSRLEWSFNYLMDSPNETLNMSCCRFVLAYLNKRSLSTVMLHYLFCFHIVGGMSFWINTYRQNHKEPKKLDI